MPGLVTAFKARENDLLASALGLTTGALAGSGLAVIYNYANNLSTIDNTHALVLATMAPGSLIALSSSFAFITAKEQLANRFTARSHDENFCTGAIFGLCAAFTVATADSPPPTNSVEFTNTDTRSTFERAEEALPALPPAPEGLRIILE